MLFKEIGIRERRIHFIGIGGIGMSGIAEILLNLGYAISGSDLQESTVTQRLRGLGATISIGHGADNVGGADAVVVSSAISDYNVELMAARHRKIPVIFRGELLAELMRLKYGIAVGGSHGKNHHFIDHRVGAPLGGERPYRRGRRARRCDRLQRPPRQQ